MLALQMCGQPNPAAADMLMGDVRTRSGGNRYDFFGSFFLAHGMVRIGGTYAKETEQFLANYFIPWQARDGSWTGAGAEQAPGRVYATTMAILSLTAREQRLPISKP